MTSPASLPSARATRDDRYLHFVCRQGEQPDVVDKARRVHAETYLHQGLVKAHAVDPLTRHLRASVDKAGERRDATYYFAQNPVDARDCATARLVGSTQTTLHDLPSYPLCAEGIDAETERDLTYLQEAHGYQFRELSAMVKSSTGAHLGILEVIRALLHDTVSKKMIIYCSMVLEVYDLMTSYFSAANYRPIGRDTKIHESEFYGRDIVFRPVIIEPDEFANRIFDAYLMCDDPEVKRAHLSALLFMARGLDPGVLREDVQDFLSRHTQQVGNVMVGEA